MYIIVKKGPSDRSFHPHFNRSIGKYIGSKEEYRQEMKKGGFVPYVDKEQPNPRKNPELSEDGRKLLREIKNQSEGQSFNPSGNLKKKLIEKKVIRKREEIETLKKKALNGGFE